MILNMKFLLYKLFLYFGSVSVLSILNTTTKVFIVQGNSAFDDLSSNSKEF